MATDALFDLADLAPSKPEPVYSVHCFFSCGHVTRASDPKTSGDAMEQHYSEAHDSDIDRALGFIGVRRHPTEPPADEQQPKEADDTAALLNGCPAAHGALGRICELPKGHAGMHTGDGPNGGAVWEGDAS